MVLLVWVWPVSFLNRKNVTTGQKTALVKKFHCILIVGSRYGLWFKCSTGEALHSHPLCASLCWTPTHFLPISHRHRMYSSRNNKTEDQQRFCRGPSHWALSAPYGLVFNALMTFLFNVFFFFLNMHTYFQGFLNGSVTAAAAGMCLYV